MVLVILAGARRLRAQAILATIATLLFSLLPVLSPAVAQAQILGGFIELPLNLTTALEPVLTTSEMNSFLPSKGKFTFPAPYNTEAVRLTNAADCGGKDCVNAIGYSYWRNINNHAGQDNMLILIGLSQARGGVGLSMLQYTKSTGALVNLGPLFPSNSPYGAASGEGWYFSATLPTKMYMHSGSKIMRYDVVSKQMETIVDVTTHLGAGRIVHQIHSSNDDRVHSATIRNSSTYEMLGCMAFETTTNKFQYFPRKGSYDECQVDKSGKWLVIKENVDGAEGEDNRIINLENGTERLLRDSAGAGGHSDLGYGYMVAQDNWAPAANTQKVWDFNQSTMTGVVAYANKDWNVTTPAHVSHTNAKNLPASQQFACGSAANRRNSAQANEIICFKLDGSNRTMVVAPVMTSLDSRPGDDYDNMPKGNLDVTGEYFIWTSNLGGSRLDAFLVKVPSQLLTGTSTGGTITTPTPAPTPIPTPITGDTTAPTITGLDASQVTNATAAIAWTTSEAANGTIEYGTTTAYGQSASLGLSFSTAHFHTLSGLNAGTVYHYRVRSADASGNLAYSTDRSFTTTNVAGGSAPAVTLTAPVNGGMTSGIITISATASDDVGIAGVQFQVNGVNVGAEDTSAPYTTTWDSTGNSGDQVFRAIARDVSGATTTSATATIRLIAKDTVVPLISGVTATNVNGTWASIKWATNENVQQRVEYGTTAAYGVASTIEMNYRNSHDVTLTGLQPGTLYHYRVRSRDFAGNIATSQDYTFTTGTSSTSAPVTGAPAPATSAPVGTAAPVVWVETSNVTRDGGTLRKTSGCDGCADSGGASEQRINGDGYLEFTATVESGLRYVGLADSNNNNAASDIDFGLRVMGSTVEVRENGTYRSDTTLAAGDVFRISVDNVRVTYVKNGAVFYTSTVTPAAQLRADAALYSPGSSISNAKIAGSAATSLATWTNLVNVTNVNGVLTKVGGCEGCADAGTVSAEQITSGNGYVEFVATIENKNRSVGLTGIGSNQIAYGLSVNGGIAEVRENNTYRSDTSIVAGDVLRVTVESGRVSYAKNGVAFYTSTIPVTAPLRAGALFYSVGGTIKNAVIRAQ